MSAGGTPILLCEAITKSFFGVKAVDDVSFELDRGAILGLVGENGAGKSTLMNILGGVLDQDAGTMSVAGARYEPRSPRDAKRSGIAFIHQELNLFSNLSVAENLYIDGFPKLMGLPILDARAMHRKARNVLDAVGLDVRPSTRVETLTPGERQLVEIGKAIDAQARIIIFDEPTTSLTDRETERLFDMLGTLRDQGTAIIYISHILDDVLDLADEVMVMRDGVLVEKGPRASFDTGRMISLMVGREIDQLFPERIDSSSSEVLLEVQGLSQPGIVHDVDLRLHAGEVLGMFGLMGSGRTEFARILFGIDPYQTGEIRVHGRRLEQISPGRAIAEGLAFVTEDRRGEGLMMHASIIDNISLVTLQEDAEGPFGVLDRRERRQRVDKVGDQLKIKAADYEQPVKTLSGGNQQKVVLGKWITATPKIFLLDEPTRGVDVGAKYDVYGLIHELAADGAGVLFISSELEELVGVCDRIVVMHNGEIVQTFDRGAFDHEKILAAAFREVTT